MALFLVIQMPGMAGDSSMKTGIPVFGEANKGPPFNYLFCIYNIQSLKRFISYIC